MVYASLTVYFQKNAERKTWKELKLLTMGEHRRACVINVTNIFAYIRIYLIVFLNVIKISKSNFLVLYDLMNKLIYVKRACVCVCVFFSFVWEKQKLFAFRFENPSTIVIVEFIRVQLVWL